MPTPDGQPDPHGGEPDHTSQTIRRRNHTARMPKGVIHGVYGSTITVLHTPTEFVLDVLQTLSPPARLATRVVLPPTVMQRLVVGLGQAIEQYEARFGPLPAPPKPPDDQPRTALEDLYNELAYADETLSGTYANTVRLNFNQSDFCLDFIASFLPHASVSARVYMSAAQTKRALESMRKAVDNARRRGEQGPQGPGPLGNPPSDAGPFGPDPDSTGPVQGPM